MEWISVEGYKGKDNSDLLLKFEESGGYISYGIGFYNHFHEDIQIVYNPYKGTSIDYKLTDCAKIIPPTKKPD